MKSFFSGVVVFLIGITTAHAADVTGRYKTIVDQMNQLHSQYPNYSEIYSVGTNDDGVPIYAMRVSVTPSKMDPAKVGQLVVATHHGNELAAPTFTMAFTKKLLERFASQELFRGQLADTEWTIIPVLNIPGYNANQRAEKGQDPNRDYPGPCITSAGGKLKSIRTMMEVAASRIYAGSLTVHGYVGAITYPWGVDSTDVKTHDHNQFDQITAKAAAINGYQYGTSTDVVYPADGTFEDYSYWKHGIWSLLLELKDGSASDIEKTVEATHLYFDLLDSSPSTKNQMTGQCRANRMNLRID
jgi:hypothetical protein